MASVIDKAEINVFIGDRATGQRLRQQHVLFEGLPQPDGQFRSIYRKTEEAAAVVNFGYDEGM